eukprot:160571-Amphidinium_carterae.1
MQARGKAYADAAVQYPELGKFFMLAAQQFGPSHMPARERLGIAVTEGGTSGYHWTPMSAFGFFH